MSVKSSQKATLPHPKSLTKVMDGLLRCYENQTWFACVLKLVVSSQNHPFWSTCVREKSRSKKFPASVPTMILFKIDSAYIGKFWVC